MLYLSKGIVLEDSVEKRLNIERHGKRFLLTSTEAAMWLNGRLSFSRTRSVIEECALKQLVRIGLAEAEEEESSLARYKILSRCICCPAEKRSFGIPLFSKLEREILIWIREAGVNLSTAELIYLQENNIHPDKVLLTEENRQNLVDKLYMKYKIQDNGLEKEMELAIRRDKVIAALMKLLKKKRIVLL